jgi:hypothetical protein
MSGSRISDDATRLRDRDFWRLLMKTKFAGFLATAFILATAAMFAHHSAAAEFDESKPLTIKGTVTRIEWMNPHAYFYLDITGADGKLVNWGMELASPNGLMRNGWTRNTLKIGDLVTVEGLPAKDRSNVGSARVVVLAATGRRLFAGSAQEDSGQP